MKKSQFVIFAHARSGSNTLKDILEKHPKIRVMLEPFNKDRSKWKKGNKNLKKKIKNMNFFRKILKDISKQYNGFKTLDYQLPVKYNTALLKSEDYKIIFLHRKNLLKAVVSGLIAEQTNVWTVEEKGRINQNKILKPLNLNILKTKINFLNENISLYKNILEKNHISYIDVSYEELYESSRISRFNKVKRIFRFLEYPLPSSNKLREIENLLNPKRKISGLKLYKNIPNINEIEKKFGNRKNRFLLQ